MITAGSELRANILVHEHAFHMLLHVRTPIYTQSAIPTSQRVSVEARIYARTNIFSDHGLKHSSNCAGRQSTKILALG